MKIINKYKYLLLLTAALTVFTSCKKFLDQDPISQATDQTTWKTDDDANSGIAACYSLIRSALNASVCFYTYGDLPTDYFDNVLDGDFLDIHNFDWAISVSSSNVYDPKLKLRLYTPFYAAVQQCNRSLYFIDQMPVSAFTGDTEADQQARKNKYKGEAYFTRAFNYFYMARVWGDVPLETTYQAEIDTITGVARTPQKQVLASCISDLNMARQYLSWKDVSSADRVVRGDKGAVFTLLAHIYAWRGDYDSCRIYCDSVINSGTYSLADGNNLAAIYAGQSDEGIFEIAQDLQSEAMNANAYSASIALYALCAPYLPNVTQPNWQINKTLFGDLYNSAADQRAQTLFATVASGSSTFITCTKYSNIQTITAGNAVNYYLLKNNIIVFRYADVLLLKAEALAAQAAPDYSTALALVNQVRARSGAEEIRDVPDRISLLDLVTAERGRELFLEGSRYYDLVRNERLTGETNFTNITTAEFTAGKYYWPVDPSLFTLNPLLKQTPYWQALLTH